jgi:hypothetical protein
MEFVARYEISNADQGATILRTLPKHCPIVAVVPKSAYLLRQMELPNVGPDEVAAMLRLEIEAAVPPTFGPAEIAARQLTASAEDRLRYEVYIIRTVDLGNLSSAFESLGIRPSLMVPSALLWQAIARRSKFTGILSGAVGANEVEACFVGADGATVIRSMWYGGGGPDSIQRPMTEFVRSWVERNNGTASTAQLGWIGPAQEVGECTGGIRFENMTDSLVAPVSPASVPSAPGAAFVVASMAAVLQEQNWDEIEKANLVPAEQRRQELVRQARRAFAIACLTPLLALAVVWCALAVATVRYGSIAADLNSRIATIEAEGQAIGVRVLQLERIQQARRTRNDVRDVVAALYHATPAGLTFSSIEVNADGEVQLRGQADSVALPFELPERLENEQAFSGVLLTDAGQSKRGEGSITEFRIECRLDRGVRP